MTLLDSTLLIYFLIGAGVAIAVYVSDLARTPAQRNFQTAASLVFWPLFLPLLLQKGPAHRPAPAPELPSTDDLSKAIAQVDSELGEALRSVSVSGDFAGDVTDRLGELRWHWQAQADRIREMDRLLAQPEYAVPSDPILAEPSTERDGAFSPDPLGYGLSGMGAIAERLRKVRDEANANLMGSLARVRQISALLQLARFTVESGNGSAELLGQIEDEIDRSTNHVPKSPGAELVHRDLETRA
jgi:hypothetical protein